MKIELLFQPTNKAIAAERKNLPKDGRTSQVEHIDVWNQPLNKLSPIGVPDCCLSTTHFFISLDPDMTALCQLQSCLLPVDKLQKHMERNSNIAHVQTEEKTRFLDRSHGKFAPSCSFISLINPFTPEPA